MSSQMSSVVDNMMGTINGGMVTGQAPVAIASPAVNITMDKAFTANLDNSMPFSLHLTYLFHDITVFL